MDVKQAIQNMDRLTLIRLVEQLYGNSAANKRIIEAHINPLNSLDEHMEAVDTYMDPDESERPRIAEARKVIADYRKSTGNRIGEIDLMIRFVESGNKFTLRYGDIDAAFYNSLIKMYEKAVEYVELLPREETKKFQERLHALVQETEGMGWGYHDALHDTFQNAFPDKDA